MFNNTPAPQHKKQIGYWVLAQWVHHDINPTIHGTERTPLPRSYISLRSSIRSDHRTNFNIGVVTFVTESLTLMAGHLRSPLFIILYRLCTPVVVSSDSPFTPARERRKEMFHLTMHSTFYLRLYGVRHMVKDHSDNEKGNPLLPHRLLFLISSKGSFICTIQQTG